ncbi:MAG: hypothetical protein M0Z87_01830 [Actinomycetota bacterium]|nr:hypothetical protein [Actinomycetota bacterium]
MHGSPERPVERPVEPPVEGSTGQIGGVEGLAVGVLVLVMGMLVVVDAWAVIDAKLAVENAARQGVRAFVQAASPSTAAAGARRAADEAISASGRAPARMVFSLQGTMYRCSVVTVSVGYPVQLVPVHFGHGNGLGMLVRATHAEMVPPFRSGASGSVGGSCG